MASGDATHGTQSRSIVMLSFELSAFEIYATFAAGPRHLSTRWIRSNFVSIDFTYREPAEAGEQLITG